MPPRVSGTISRWIRGLGAQSVHLGPESGYGARKDWRKGTHHGAMQGKPIDRIPFVSLLDTYTVKYIRQRSSIPTKPLLKPRSRAFLSA